MSARCEDVMARHPKMSRECEQALAQRDFLTGRHPKVAAQP